MKKFLICITTIITTLFSVVLSACTTNKFVIKKYPPALTSFEHAIVDNLSLSSLDNRLLTNPDRGFRGETYITLGTDSAYPQSNETAYKCLDDQMALYADDSMNIVQCYVYLCEYNKKPLDDKAFSQLKDYFEYLRSNNLRILLRFAYQYTDSNNTDAKDKIIHEHLDSIGSWIGQNKELFNQVVYAMQFGIIGLWGEGHGSKYSHNIPKLMEHLAEIIPEDIFIMVRTPALLSKVPEKYEHRFGVHDDFLVGIDHEWGMLNFDHPQYQDLLNKNQYVIADGEMPWGRDNTVTQIDPILLIKQCVNYGLTTMSLTHNYKEYEPNDDKQPYHLERWKSVYITEEELTTNHFPYNPAMLTDGKISVYNYLAYHLGYNIGVSNLNTNNGISFMLNNFGMAAPHEFELEVYVNGKKYDIQPVLLKKFDQYIVNIFENNVNEVKLKYTHRRSGEHIKLANNLPYDENGFNVIYTR